MMSWVTGLFVWLYRERLAEAWDEGHVAGLADAKAAISKPLPWRFSKYEIFHCRAPNLNSFCWRLVVYDDSYRTVYDDHELATHDMALFDLIDRNINLFRPEDKPAAPREAK